MENDLREALLWALDHLEPHFSRTLPPDSPEWNDFRAAVNLTVGVEEGRRTYLRRAIENLDMALAAAPEVT